MRLQHTSGDQEHTPLAATLKLELRIFPSPAVVIASQQPHSCWNSAEKLSSFTYWKKGAIKGQKVAFI